MTTQTASTPDPIKPTSNESVRPLAVNEELAFDPAVLEVPVRRRARILRHEIRYVYELRFECPRTRRII